MFEKTLTDLVRGIRNNKNNEAKYIASCLDEIKQELRQENATVKANAVSKLTYLQMIGYDISWAAFNIIEVMSSSKFTFKRIGYFAASQCFHEDLDILMLTTNMIRKDLCSMNMYDSGVALTGFACFVSADLARDLANDVMSLLVSTKPYVRKRSVLLMYKIFLKFPESLRPAFPRLKDKLEDPDPGVQSAAVNVICELARKNPKNYLSLAPLFFKLMTSSTNNWMLIKIIKLFGALCPLEPRLGKKILEPLTNLIHSTSAMSLLYECINTVISALPNHTASVQLSLSKLRLLIEDPDQNLKYLGLLAMSKILKCQPKLVQNHKDIIMHCLDDRDESIKLRALDLIVGMVSKKNIMEIVKKLMVHIDKADSQGYCDELVSKIILICSTRDFHYVTNFEWYLDVLVQLTRVDGTRHGKLIASQMMDVAIRVKAIRPYAVQVLSLLLDNASLLSGQGQKNGVCEVLYAAAWVSGEFSEFLPEPRCTLEAMFHPRATSLPGHIQAVYVQNIAKLYASILKASDEEGDDEAVTEIGQYIVEKLPVFVQSADLEVQERASCILQLIKYVIKLQAKGVPCVDEVCLLFSGELNPVAVKAQKKVPVPEGLDLDKWINEPLSESSEGEEDMEAIFVDKNPEHRSLSQKAPEVDDEELERRRQQRKEDQLSNPHYLRLDKAKRSKSDASMTVDDIPVANLDLPVALKVSGMEKTYTSKTKKKKRKRGRKGSRADDSADEDMKYEVLPTLEMPEGAAESDEDKAEPENIDASDPHRLLNVDLEKPLEASEALPVRTHRTSPLEFEHSPEEEENHVGKSSRKHRHRKEKEEKSKHKHKKEKADKKSKKHKHHHREKAPDATEDKDLMMNGEEESAEPAISEQQQPTPAEQEKDTKPKEEQMDDMEFWLSTPPTSPVATKAPVSPPTATTTVASPSTAEEPGEHKKAEKEHKKRHKKEKSDKEKKKEKKKKETKAKLEPTPQPPEAPADTADPPSILSLDETEDTSPASVVSAYKVLSENASLRLMYETRVTTQQRNQVVISIIFSNLTELHVKSMEFNVLDSLNLKLVRPIGATKHDSVPVPFHLLPGSSNEGQFAFSVDSIAMSQKLRGTLTYMITDAQGSTSEKMDFTVHFPCSSFLVATSLASAGFASLLGSGTLANKNSIKAATPEGTTFSQLINKICIQLHFSVVEQVETSVSLYARSIQDHHLCMLVKQLDGKTVSVDGKSTDSGLISGVLDEVKSLLQS